MVQRIFRFYIICTVDIVFYGISSSYFHFIFHVSWIYSFLDCFFSSQRHLHSYFCLVVVTNSFLDQYVCPFYWCSSCFLLLILFRVGFTCFLFKFSRFVNSYVSCWWLRVFFGKFLSDIIFHNSGFL